jgi:tRNA-specific 2-thiouridylase
VYVLDKDLARNQLVVGPSSGRARRQFLAGPVHWVSERSPAGHLRVMVCVRYRSQEAPATLWPLEDGKLRVELDVGLMDVTPGQAAVFYDGDVCLGMAPILP